MNKFRQKYLYNQTTPIYTSPNVKTYNCMNIKTKNKRLIIIQHLISIPLDIQHHISILQPLQSPTNQQPFSVYPIVRCVSQIKKISQPEAMYIVKCIIQCKIYSPLYLVICDQGICCSNVEGILPKKSPPLFQLLINMLGIPENLSINKNWTISKDGYQILKSIKNGENISSKLQKYGWKNSKNRQKLLNSDYILFKALRKQLTPFTDQQQYTIAWHKQFGLCKFKQIPHDGYHQQYLQSFLDLTNYITQQSQAPTKSKLFLKIHDFQLKQKQLKIISQIANQGPLQDYLKNKQTMGLPLTVDQIITLMNQFIQNMLKFSKQYKQIGLGTLNINNLYMHNNQICLEPPLFLSNKTIKSLSTSITNYNYFSPQLKLNITHPQNFSKLNKQKMDIWSFGMLFHYLLSSHLPTFKSGKPIINNKIQSNLASSIKKCLHLNPNIRPNWNQINLNNIHKNPIAIISQISQQQPIKQQIIQIKLGNKQKISTKNIKPQSTNNQQLIYQYPQSSLSSNPPKYPSSNIQKLSKQSQQFTSKSTHQNQMQYIMSQQLLLQFKKIKIILKIVLIIVIYIFVFFRPFLFHSASFISIRSKYSLTTLNLLNNINQRVSSTTIITDNPLFFMNNEISFDDIGSKYQCIPNNFDPIYNPNYSLITYIQSNSFLALILMGWLIAVLICITKAKSIWSGGISNIPKQHIKMFLLVYIFHELSIASLLFSHFYIFQFFYFSTSTPCLSITNISGYHPLFDSSLYLILNLTSSYLQKIFSSLGILSLIIFISTCFYSYNPKLDQKYFITFPSIVFRIVPFILFVFICRIGIFMLFNPTAINDSSSLLPNILISSFNGFIGIIPQFFIIFCVIVEIGIQISMDCCMKKMMSNNRLKKLIGIEQSSQLSISEEVNSTEYKIKNQGNSQFGNKNQFDFCQKQVF